MEVTHVKQNIKLNVSPIRGQHIVINVQTHSVMFSVLFIRRCYCDKLLALFHISVSDVILSPILQISLLRTMKIGLPPTIYFKMFTSLETRN